MGPKVRRAWALLVVALVAASACRRPPVETPSTSEQSPPPTPTSIAEEGPCPRETGGETNFVHLTGVRVGTHEGYDRITFEFRHVDGASAVPSYEIEEVGPPFTRDPSDQPMEVAGESHFRIIFHGATGHDLSGETVTDTYGGPREFTPGFEVLVEAEEQGDFEATLSWIIGASRQSCWKTTELAEPLRLVIDLPH